MNENRIFKRDASEGRLFLRIIISKKTQLQKYAIIYIFNQYVFATFLISHTIEYQIIEKII